MTLRTMLPTLLLTLTTALAAADPPAAKKTAPPTMDDLWTDLAEGDIPATRAVLLLAERKDQSVAFLRTRLKPLAVSAARVRKLIAELGSPNDADAKEAFETLRYFDPRLALDLDKLFAETKDAPARQRLVQVCAGVRLPKMKDLDQAKVNLVPASPQLSKPLGVESSHFLHWQTPDKQGLHAMPVTNKVERLEASGSRFFRNTEWTRALLALMALERIATPGAVELLEAMAGGHADAAPTKAAKDALRRIAEAAAAPAGKKPPEPEWDDLWNDLSLDSVPAGRAALLLRGREEDAVAFLRKRLKPLTLSAERGRLLVAELGSPKAAVAEEAFETLQYFDPRLAQNFSEWMRETAARPARERLVSLLSRGKLADHDGETIQVGDLNPEHGREVQVETGPAAISVWYVRETLDGEQVGGRPQWTRAVRAITLLEHLGTPDAKELLETMAGGHPDAAPTKAAKDALQRLAAR